MAATLITLDQAKRHLKIPIVADDPGDPDLQLKLDAAEAAILDYIARSPRGAADVASWLDIAAPVAPPAYVLSTILLQFGELWRFRGDDSDNDAPPRHPNDELAPAIVALLRRTGDLVLG
jgi:hypothetical protein